MTFKLISCKVFEAEINSLLPEIPHQLDVTFIELGEHARPALLRSRLQAAINASGGHDAVLLAYGLCGTATEGLRAGTVPVVIPRSHDCCGILLGSRRRFEELFRAMPSTPFASVGFAASGDYYFQDGELVLGDSYARLVEQYGEDNARYVWEAMHPRLDGELQPVYFIHTVTPDADVCTSCREKAQAEGREFRELSGDLRLLRMLMRGDWPPDEFLVLKPGESIRQTADWDRIMTAAESGRYS